MLDDFGDEPTKPLFEPPAPKRWPSPWGSSRYPVINPTWVAEYAKEHELSIEVAIEHLTIYCRQFVEKLIKNVELLEKSDTSSVNSIKVFVDSYKPIEGFYSPIPLVKVFNKEGKECLTSIPKKKSLLNASMNSSKE